MESQKGLPCGSLEGMRITNFADILFISYHVTDHPISLFEFYYLQEPSSASLFYILSYPILSFFTHLRTPPVFFNLSHKVKSNYQISSALTITILTYIIYSQNIYTFLIWTCLFLQLGVRKKERKKVEIHFLRCDYASSYMNVRFLISFIKSLI